jgi:transcriptional regulator with XRE-family HTH domain
MKDNEALEFRRARARKIEQALRNKSWTRAKLAELTGYDVRTIRTVLKGEDPVRDQTILDVCEALGIEPELDSPAPEEVEISDSRHGSYVREAYRQYEGAWFGVRRSFNDPYNLVRSLFQISWHPEDWIFVFEESQAYQSEAGRQVDHSQKGELYISQFTDLIHLVTVTSGAVRTITLTKVRSNRLIMRGSVLTQADRENVFYAPSVSAIYLEKISNFDSGLHLDKVGLLRPGDHGYEEAASEIVRIERNVIHIAGRSLDQSSA